MTHLPLRCLCGFESISPEFYIQHMIETGHGCSPEIQHDLATEPKLRDEFVATLLALQTCKSPEEIGATPVTDDDDDTD